MPAKPTKKRNDVPPLPKPTGVASKKSRLQRRRDARPRRRHAKKRKRKRTGDAWRKTPASDPSKRHSDAKTKSHGGRSPNGPEKQLQRKLLPSPRQARSAFLSRRKKNPRRHLGGGPGRRSKNLLRRLDATICVGGLEKSRSHVRLRRTKENEFGAGLRCAAPEHGSGSGCIRANRSKSRSYAKSLSPRQSRSRSWRTAWPRGAPT